MSWTARLDARWTRPDHPAVIDRDEMVTYGQLRARIARARGWLRAHGVGPGDGVALQMPRCLAFLELHLATLSLGAWTLPLNPAYTAAEVGFALSDARPRLAVLPDPGAVETCIRVVPAATVRLGLDASAPAPSLDVPGGTLACLCYTSGTTGRPKGARISHDNLAFTVQSLHEAWRWTRDDVLLHVLPLFHIHGLFVAQHGALFAGATAVWLHRFDAAAALQAIETHRATVFMGVPTHHARFLALPPDQTVDLSSMRLFTSGSAPLPARDHAAFLARFGHAILERYGMTEVGIVLSNPYDGPRVPGTVGFPLPGVVVQVTNPEQGRPVEDGAVGELWIRGPGVIDRYHERPDATATALTGGWMRSGDLARRDPDTGRLSIVGRARDMVISGGLNVYPAEVEAVLREHPAVAHAAVVGIPDPDLGERVVAAVVLHEPTETTALLDHCRTRLARYKQPRELRRVGALPRNTMGKVQKHRIRDGW
ncbi:MAG: AMP-binding protein [Myxococcota bacterium]|nr:AMP-binding protein [Myxococcota bacterium]